MEYSIMADVKIHECFPTMISEFSYHPDKLSQQQMTGYIKEVKKNHKFHTDDKLYNMSYYADLRDAVLVANKDYVKKLGYHYKHLEITGMWANYLYEGDAHPPHTHSNNFLSGVYYLEAEDGASPIQFFDPRPQANVLRPRNKANWQNCSMIQFDAIKGVGYIFPSWLQHWVPPTNGKRISISWNIILRGDYGEPGTLQNAHI